MCSNECVEDGLTADLMVIKVFFNLSGIIIL